MAPLSRWPRIPEPQTDAPDQVIDLLLPLNTLWEIRSAAGVWGAWAKVP